MNQNKRGVSLIVLVITIIVIIILAAAVILTINNNNPMDNANKARYMSDRANVQNSLSTAVGKIAADKQCSITIPTQLNIASGIGYTLTGAIDGITKGKIGWDSLATVSSAEEATTILGMKIPNYSVESKWHIDQSGNVILKIGNYTYSEAGEQYKKVLVTRKISDGLFNQFKKEYPGLEYNPNLTYDEIIVGNYDIVINDSDYGACNNPDLINQLFDHGISVVTIGNDNITNLDIIKSATAASNISYVANKKAVHYISQNMPDTCKQDFDTSITLITLQNNAIPLYVFTNNGKEYVAMGYMENEQGGKWLHSQMSLNASQHFINYFVDALNFL